MDKVKKWKYECDGKKLVDILNAKKYDAIYVDNIGEAKEKVLELLPRI